MPTATPGIFRFEGYTVDRTRWTLTWNDQPIPLKLKTFELLLRLLEHHDVVQTKEHLLEALWPDRVVEESNVTQQIFLLRKALSLHTSQATIVETVAGRGYRFVAPLLAETAHDAVPAHSMPVDSVPAVSAQAVSVPAGFVVPPISVTMAPERRPHRRTAIAAGIAALGVLAAGVAGWQHWRNGSGGPPIEVVLADFTGTEDPALQRTLNDALRIDLKQSPFLTVLSSAKLNSALATMRRSDAPLTAAIAREVCERLSAQVLLQGNISKFGDRYLVHLRANSCVITPGLVADGEEGEVLAEDKTEAARLDDLPGAIDSLAAKMRRDLGESRASIRRFDKPLFPANTGSLAALRAYSEGLNLGNQGDMAGALPLFQRAVELDPEFGIAYFDIAVSYYMLNDSEHERPALEKAYALRNTVPDVSRLYITALYHFVITGDIAKSVETYKTLMALYPRNPIAPANLADEYDAIGRPGLGIEYAQRALALAPSVAPIYLTLASTQLHNGQAAAAQHTCELAIARNLDGADLRHVLLQALAAQQDPAGVEAQLAWGREHGDAPLLRVDEISLALSRGEVRKAERLLAALRKTSQPAALEAKIEAALTPISRALADEGMTAQSVGLVQALPASARDENTLVALVESGQLAQARDGLDLESQEHSTAALWKGVRLPQIQAAIALAEHQPDAALDALLPALPFDGLSFGGAFLRAQAYVDLGQFDEAINEYQKITLHPTVDPLSSEYPLAVLAEARAYDEKNERAKAREGYQRFLNMWKNADLELTQLQTAKLGLKTVIARLPEEGARTLPN